MAGQTANRDPQFLTTDQAALRALTQMACDVELFTIPLYMTTLYSIQGFYAAPSGTQQWWPGVVPNPYLAPDANASPNTPAVNQQVYNLIFSVYIQEMLHLQLASNLASAVGQTPQLAVPTYAGQTIPGIVDLSQIPQYQNVQVRLGPLDDNAIQLFLAIEEPDWDAIPVQDKPAVPFAGWQPGQPLPLFGTIGHMYQCIHGYMDLTYQDGGGPTYTLWDKTYAPNAIQVDIFNFQTSQHPDQEYPFDVKFPPGLSAADARSIATTLIDAICDQGEGASASQETVKPKFVPSEAAMWDDYDPNSAVVRAEGDMYSHYQRFEAVQKLLDQVVTWPMWWNIRGNVGAWCDSDLAGDQATPEQKLLARQRADALNDPNTAAEINAALDSSFTSLLSAIQGSWDDADTAFPYAAMQALSTRVSAVWAANGVPEFKSVPAPSISDAHACQGLDPKNPGKNTEVNAVIHTCATANSCKHQGGCGYPVPADDGYPSVNKSVGGGGCGAPIPVAQVFGSGGPWTYQGVTMNTGDSVWDKAWEIFQKTYPNAPKPTQPTSLRLVLPPS